jgi:hypothetical protein
MAVTAPSFNLTVDYFAPGNLPNGGSPDASHLPAQLYIHSRADIAMTKSPPGTFIPPVYWRMPYTFMGLIGPPIVDGFIQWTDPDGNVWNYQILWWEWTHANFPNAYIEMFCVQCQDDGTVPDGNR